MRDRIEHRRFVFAANKAVLQSSRYTQTLYNQAQDIKTLIKTANTLGESLSIKIYAHGDQRGTDSQTLQLANTRARYIRKYLIDQGVEKDVLSVQGQAIDGQAIHSERIVSHHTATDEESAAYLEVQL